jgi:hypothetical protein
MDRIKGDERILGDSEFVMAVLDQANEHLDRRYALKSQGYDLARVAARVAELMDVDPEAIFQKGRQKKRAEARGLFCYWCVAELGISQTELSRKLKMTVSGVGYAVTRGKATAGKGNYRLFD